MRSTLMAAGCCLALSLGACHAPAPARQPPGSGYLALAAPEFTRRGALTVQLDYDTVEAGGLDPQTAATARSWTLGSLVYEPLVTVGPDFTVQPLLASGWHQPAATQYVFTLRKGVTFSNGRPLTPADAVGSLNRLLKSKAPYAAQLGPVKSVTATGPAEVTVTLTKPHTPFLAALANTPAAILPMKEIDEGTLDPSKQMLGTGPYVVHRHRQDQYWEFGENPRYRHAGNVAVTDLRIEIVPQEAARLAALRNGRAGLVTFNNVDSMDQLAGTHEARTVSQQNSDFYYLILNSKNPQSPLAERKVRSAVAAALDREQIAALALGGKSRPTGVTPAVLPGACTPTNPASGTRVTLDEPLRLAVYTSEPAVGQIAQVIQQQLAAAGVPLTIEKYDDSTYTAKVFGAEPDFDLALGWFAGYADPAMAARWWNPRLAGFSSTFLTDDRTLDGLIDTAASAPDGPARTKTLAALCARVTADAQMLPLVTRPTALGYRADQVSPTLRAAEGYGNVLRDVATYTLPGTE